MVLTKYSCHVPKPTKQYLIHICVWNMLHFVFGSDHFGKYLVAILLFSIYFQINIVKKWYLVTFQTISNNKLFPILMLQTFLTKMWRAYWIFRPLIMADFLEHGFFHLCTHIPIKENWHFCHSCNDFFR